jgi:AI-2 transport protein TqsA
MNLIKRFLLRLDPAHRLTTEELLRHPWVSGQYFDDLRAKREGAHELADGNHHRKVGAHNEVLTPMNQLSGSVRRMRLCNAKRKFRSGIRTLIAQNALEGMLVGMQRQQLLLQIGAQYNEKKLMALYGLFEQQAKQDRRESKPLKNALDIMKGPKTVIAKGSFAAVVMKVLPDIARSEAAAEAHFADFRGTRLLDAVDDADFSDVDLSKYPKGKKEKEKAQVRALAEAHREVVGDLLDYRAYCDLFDDDRSGQIDADEFAELMRGILVSESMPDGMLKMELKRDFESIDEDNNGTIDKTEFIVAATSYPRLQEYLAHLSRLATNANDEATRNQDLQEKRRAATKMQAAFRGRMDRKKVQQKAVDKDTLTHKIFTRHIVYSHPVFQTEYELSMPISQQRELALKKLFALADLEHFGRLGPSQFRDLLKLLEVDIDPGAAMRMFRHMDDDMGGFIEFEEFADAMLEGFSSEDIIAASEVEIGNMGTRMWSRGEVAWNANSAMVLCSTCIIFAGLEYFQFVLVPLLFSYFLNFLMAPLMLLLEARPCTIRQQQFCQLSAAPMRIEIHGTSKATLWDFVHSCRFPHGASVLCTLLLTILVLGGVAIVATLETMQLLNDAEFVAGWQLLVSDIRTLFKHTGVHIVTEEVDGYTADEITQFLSNFGNFFNQLALVLLLTVYIMSTHTVDKESNPLPGQASKIDAMMKFYINLKTAISLLTGIATAVILRLCGVKLAVMFGILAFLLNYIPNFGSMVAMVLPLPIILVDAGLSTVQKTLGALGPALVQGYVGNVLEPSVFGRSLNMTPLSILIALVMWMSIWGVLGAVMAVPLLGIQKIFLEHANHPIASACLILIREDPNVDEAEQARMQKRMLAKQGGEPDEPQHRRKGAIARSHSVYQEVSDEGLDYTASWRANPEHVLPMGGGLDV